MQINATGLPVARREPPGRLPGCTKPAQGADSKCYDVGNTVLHEAGHSSADHVQCIRRGHVPQLDGRPAKIAS